MFGSTRTRFIQWKIRFFNRSYACSGSLTRFSGRARTCKSDSCLSFYSISVSCSGSFTVWRFKIIKGTRTCPSEALTSVDGAFNIVPGPMGQTECSCSGHKTVLGPWAEARYSLQKKYGTFVHGQGDFRTGHGLARLPDAP